MPLNFDRNARLSEVKGRSLGTDMPVPLHERIDELCDLVYKAGRERPSKKKMLAALVLGATTDTEALDELLRAYERAKVQDALVAPQEDAEIVAFPERRSGPRAKPK